MPTPNITTIRSGASSVLTEKPNHWARQAVRDCGHLVHQPDDDQREERDDHAAEHQGEQDRINSTVAIEMIFSARLNALA